MHPSFFLMLLGIVLSSISWIWFRHPGQSIWIYAPVWEAPKYLNKTGVRLWVIGSIIGVLSIPWAIWYVYFSG